MFNFFIAFPDLQQQPQKKLKGFKGDINRN